jgi:glycosyltransferase involved in cell wall biosynthesis
MTKKRIRVLYSFPHKLGAERICYTAWQQVNGLAKAGADVLVHPGVLHRSVREGVRVTPTLARGRLRIPYKALGLMRACALHDKIVARRLRELAAEVDVVHTWPLAAKETLIVARELGIPTVLERANAHTRFAYEVVRKECERLGVPLPPKHEHAYNEDILRKEEQEYALADRLLCPSEFVKQTFLDQRFDEHKLLRHFYGYDEKRFYPVERPQDEKGGLRALFVGVCAVRKGLHFALEAWLRSAARENGTFSIAGEFLPAYAAKLEPMLRHPSVHVLGHRADVPELMRQSDILVLPTIEEGFALVCTEAMGSGCVPVVSNACTDFCRHMENSLIHAVGDVKTLTCQLDALHKDRSLLRRLRLAGLGIAPKLTWDAAGIRLRDAYEELIQEYRSQEALTPRFGIRTDALFAQSNR